VTNGANVYVRFCPLKFLFCHFNSPKNKARVVVLCLHPIAGSRRTGTAWHWIADRLKNQLGTEQTASQFDQSRNVFILPLKPQ
jgi:hypothetical protein